MNYQTAWLCMLCLLQACTDRTPETDSYFPLAAGLHWTYRVTTNSAGTIKEERFEQYNADPDQMDDVMHAVRVTDQGTRYYIRETGDGVFRAAKRTLVELYPRPDTPQRWILKRPFQLGNTWSHETHPYVLRRLQPYEESLTKSVTFKMAYQIAALNDTVDVPAGRFENCIRVDGDAQLSLYTHGRTGYQDIKINTSEWYAPGVGLVKLARHEPLNGEVYTGGSVVFELDRFER
ncbi:MAG: hypothetical protein GY807_24945 [Gammaproteobacteria bacterium]|nr:hypothetical protein [Gammaproteobacteria bacterium]